MDEKEEYDDLLKVKARIWEIKKGKPTKLKALGIIFVSEEESETQIQEQKQEKIISDKENETETETETELVQTEIFQLKDAKDKGKKIGHIGTNSVFENILADVKEGISRSEEIAQLTARIAAYYPNTMPSSHGVYLSAHRRFLESNTLKPEIFAEDKGERVATESGVPIFANILEKIKLCGNDTQEMEKIISEYHPDIKEKSVEKYVYSYRKNIGGGISPKSYTRGTKKRRRRRKPKGAIGKDDTYNVWIMPDEYNNVKKAINKWGFTATTESIMDVTGLKDGRVRAVIHWMLKKHEIYMTRDKHVPTYHSIVS